MGHRRRRRCRASGQHGRRRLQLCLRLVPFQRGLGLLRRAVAAVGVRDLVIVETDDAIFVSPRERAQEVKEIVSELDRAERPEVELHARVYRPWGYYEGVAEGDRFQVKRISVKPGEKLSLQMHHHRAEHWVVVEGTARVTNGDQEILLSENQSTYNPIGGTNRL